jgi:two-component system, sensor histidine kinase and response regulator
MLTSGDRGDDIARCRKLGISSYLTKPVRRAELRTAIVAALAHEIPRGDPAALRDAVLSNGFQKVHGASCRILLTEDNIVNQRVALRILEKAGHVVAVAENGKVALGMLAERTFDLILMDVQMPEMGGFEATALIREKEEFTGRHIPIVAMTAHAMAGDRERCLDAGMDDYLAKPVAAASLLDMVAQYSPKPLPVEVV